MPLTRNRLLAGLDLIGLVLARPVAWLLLLCASVGIVAADVLAPPVVSIVEASSIRTVAVQAVAAPVARARLPWTLWGSGVHREPAGPMRLFEDGVGLGPGNVDHGLIQRLGGGRFSHWYRDLVFSSSDGSDPRANGRIYTYEVPSRLHPGWMWFAAALLALGLSGLMRWRLLQSEVVALTARLKAAAWVTLAAGGLGVLLLGFMTLAPAQATLSVNAADAGVGRAGLVRTVDPQGCCRWPYRIPAGHSVAYVQATGGGTELRQVTVVALSDGRLLAFNRHGPEVANRLESITLHLQPQPSAWVAVIALLLTGALGVVAASRPNQAPLLAGPSIFRTWHTVVFEGSLIALFIAVIVTRWYTSTSTFLGVASLLPVSDAMGYFRCAIASPDPGQFAISGMPVDWCARRVLYPLSLATLLTLAGGSAGVALLMQAGLVGASLAAFVVWLRRTVNPVTGVVAGIIVASFVLQYAVGNFVTEFLGLSCGLVAAALLLFFARRPEPISLFGGLALLGLGLSSRAGAMFALPMVALWGYWVLKPAGQRLHGPSLLLVVAAGAFGPLLQFLGAWSIGADPTHTGGNFSTSLYGLSTGSRDWSEAYRQFEALFRTQPESEVFRVVRRAALDNIVAQPGVFLSALQAAASSFVFGMFQFAEMPTLGIVASGLLLIGCVICLRRRHEPVMSLVLVVFLAELLAAPLIIDSGGHRVLAVTFWCRATLAGIGLATVIDAIVRRVSSGARHEWTFVAAPAGVLVLAMLLVLLPIVPMTPIARAMRQGAVSATPQCAPGQYGLIARIGAESMALGVTSTGRTPLDAPLEVRPGLIERDLPRLAAWWGQDIGPMPPGSWIILAFDRQAGRVGQLYSLFWQGEWPASPSGLYAICAAETVDRKLGDYALRRVASIRALTSD